MQEQASHQETEQAFLFYCIFHEMEPDGANQRLTTCRAGAVSCANAQLMASRATPHLIKAENRSSISAFVPFVGDLENILCIHEERIAGRDNTVRYNGLVLQIPASRDRYHFAKATIRVLEYHDGRIALFHGPRKIARFLAHGSLDEGAAVRKQSVA